MEPLIREAELDERPTGTETAAVAMLDAMETFERDHHHRLLILMIGLHKGASIAVTLNDRLDYFGQAAELRRGYKASSEPRKST